MAVPNSAPDSLTPRNLKLPLPEEDDEAEEEEAAAAELVALPLAPAALLVAALEVAGAAEVAEVAAAVAPEVSTAAADEVAATEEKDEATVGAAAPEVLAGDLLLQFRRATPGAGAARAQAARPAAIMEEETRILNECGFCLSKRVNEWGEEKKNGRTVE